MNPMIGMSTTLTFAALVVFVLCSGGQIVHGYLRMASYGPESRRLVIVYESAIFLHLLLMALFTFEGMQGAPTLSLHLLGFSIPLIPLFWINIWVAAATVHAAMARLGDNSALGPSTISLLWMPPIETVIACACLPVTMQILGESWTIVLFVDAIYFMFRTTFVLLLGIRIRATAVTQLSIVEALKSFPEGLLYADEEGRTLAANDTMRHCLSELGLPNNYANADELVKLLKEKAAGENAVEAIKGLQEEGEPWLFLEIAPNEIRLFSFEGWENEEALQSHPDGSLEEGSVSPYPPKRLFGPQPFKHIFAFDVTQEVETLKAINRTNAELAAQHNELMESMVTVREAAENEAMLRMRGRVHDIIGQRLSMLHRALEDDTVSDEQLEQLKPLLNGILDDLAVEANVNPADELAATIGAFSLTGVHVNVEGDLPADPTVAKVFADCIREACTNAVKHARSTEIVAKITPEGLSISNDGLFPVIPIHEGTGLGNMRHAATQIGATLEIDADEPPFTIRIMTS